MSKWIGARCCILIRMSSMPKLSLPPLTQTITRSPSSIMLKSMMAWPTWRHRRFSNLWVSRSIFSRLGAGVVSAEAFGRSRVVSVSVQVVFISSILVPFAGFHADGHFTVCKNFKFGDLHPHAFDTGQLHQAVGQLADQRFEQVDVFGGAFVDDDFAYLAVVQHAANVIVRRQQGLRAQTQFGIHLDRLGRSFLGVKDAQVGIKAQ